MRACRETGGANKADHLALPHAPAFFDAARKSGHVAVSGLIAIGMAETNVLAVARLQAGLLHDAVAGGVNRRAARSGPVHTSMHLGVAEDRVAAQAEARAADSGEHRFAHQKLLRALARLVVVVDEAVVRRLEAVELLGL